MQLTIFFKIRKIAFWEEYVLVMTNARLCPIATLTQGLLELVNWPGGSSLPWLWLDFLLCLLLYPAYVVHAVAYITVSNPLAIACFAVASPQKVTTEDLEIRILKRLQHKKR